jgi:hypothetical protein
MLAPKVILEESNTITTKTVTYPNGIVATYQIHQKNKGPLEFYLKHFEKDGKCYRDYLPSETIAKLGNLASNTTKFSQLCVSKTNLTIQTEEDLLKFTNFDNIFDLHSDGFLKSITGKTVSTCISIDHFYPYLIETDKKAMEKVADWFYNTFNCIHPLNVELVPHYNQNDNHNRLMYTKGLVDIGEEYIHLFESKTKTGLPYFSFSDGMFKLINLALNSFESDELSPKAIDYSSKMMRETALQIYTSADMNSLSDSSINEFCEDITWCMHDQEKLKEEKYRLKYKSILRMYDFKEYGSSIDLLAFAVLELVFNNGKFLE